MEEAGPEMQTYLGDLYRIGKIVNQDYGAAVAQDLALARSNLGIMYRYGLGVPQNDTEALKLFLKAADQEDASAFLFLGHMYLEGRGCKCDPEKALYCFLKSARMGHPQAIELFARYGLDR